MLSSCYQCGRESSDAVDRCSGNCGAFICISCQRAVPEFTCLTCGLDDTQHLRHVMDYYGIHGKPSFSMIQWKLKCKKFTIPDGIKDWSELDDAIASEWRDVMDIRERLRSQNNQGEVMYIERYTQYIVIFL